MGVKMESVVGEADIFVSTTGNFKIIRLEHMKAMKNNAIVGNIGHFDNEIEMELLEKFWNQGREHQATGGPLSFPGWPWSHYSSFWSFVQLGLCHWSPILRDVLLLHKPGAGTVGLL